MPVCAGHLLTADWSLDFAVSPPEAFSALPEPPFLLPETPPGLRLSASRSHEGQNSTPGHQVSHGREARSLFHTVSELHAI